MAEETANDNIDRDEDLIIVECPHCGGTVIIHKQDLNCKIFRHGTYKRGGQQIPSHASKSQCDMLYNGGHIYGCARPFKIEIKTEDNISYIAVECDYI